MRESDAELKIAASGDVDQRSVHALRHVVSEAAASVDLALQLFMVRGRAIGGESSYWPPREEPSHSPGALPTGTTTTQGVPGRHAQWRAASSGLHPHAGTPFCADVQVERIAVELEADDERLS